MGAHLCSEADAQVRGEALRFHAAAQGAQVRVDERGRTARRGASFRDGIVFSQRPVRPGERVALRVLRQEPGWCGGLRVGFTRLDPAHVPAPGLPPFVCPDLEAQSPTWAAVLPESCVRAGNVVCFWVNHRGWLFAKVNAGRPLLLRRDVLLGSPLWAVMDVYGTTKAIELLDSGASPCTSATLGIPSEEAQPDPKAPPGEECIICFHHAADTRFVPCGHPHFCSACAWRVFEDTAKCPMCRWQIEGVAAVQPPRTGGGS
ncbi:PREDICTED: E3 ubiquitin-protein ligase NEURL3 [Chinchilla lanigera]|uniref:E3 ubiquitin-protein ligase NEURL3 n=1 Tax=Chinchilla lanigera TaxID=34839 RepID=UPI00069818AE|nr:PREDICTED: E3 ubiquitin-protein ligase NEURL3 [Chinchilla lanigera]